jgi:membrane protease YdiL (CAAX protease family)
MNFIQQAYKGKNEWYHYLGTLALVFIGWQFLGVIPLVIAAVSHSENLGDFAKAAEDSFMKMGINSNLFLFLMIFTFAIGLLFLFIGIKYVHKRNFTSLVTSRKKIDWKRVFYAFLLWGALSVVIILISIFIEPEIYIWNFNPIPFFILVLISFLFLPLQTSFEELLFRGYFMQALGLLTKNRWFPLLFTSVFFGLLHAANPEVEKLGYISMVFYIGTGLFFGIATLMDEGTELAIGLHAANNIVAAFFVTANWTVFQTDALYIDTSEPSVGWEMFFPVLVIYPIILVVFSRKYGWSNWREKLLGSIEKPISIEE